MRHCQIAVLFCSRDIISLNLRVYVIFYVGHEDSSLLHVKVSILDLRLHHEERQAGVVVCFTFILSAPLQQGNGADR